MTEAQTLEERNAAISLESAAILYRKLHEQFEANPGVDQFIQNVTGFKDATRIELFRLIQSNGTYRVVVFGEDQKMHIRRSAAND